MIQPNPHSYDAIVVGGGPAGATAASVLARHGRSVVVLEKDKFPRYHIGESLLPFCYFPLERIGALDKVKNHGFTKKYSVQFVNPEGKQSQPFYFFNHMQHEAAQTWQVWRDEFDLLLLDHAREQGAAVFEETAAKALIEENGVVRGVVAEGRDGERFELRAPITIDASGRGTFAQGRQQWRKMDAFLNKMAVWTYYKGAMRDEGYAEGATTVAFVPEKGWFWYIPLPGDTVSVGIVAERSYLLRHGREPETIFNAEIQSNTWIEEHLAAGTQTGPFYATGEYSYRSEFCARDGLVLAGDAFAFLDPVFSSGVFLALRSGEMAAQTAEQALREGDVSALRFKEYGETVCEMIEAMRKLVYAFYDVNFSFRQVIDANPRFQGDITNLLIGNLGQDFSELFDEVMKHAQVPEALPHGRPMIQCPTAGSQ